MVQGLRCGDQAKEGALEEVFVELRQLYDLIWEHGMPVSSLEQASFATAVPDWALLHSILADVESSHKDNVTKFNEELVEGASPLYFFNVRYRSHVVRWQGPLADHVSCT